jgi:hypothetical protein
MVLLFSRRRVSMTPDGQAAMKFFVALARKMYMLTAPAKCAASWAAYSRAGIDYTSTPKDR